jgi:hypothetical protein
MEVVGVIELAQELGVLKLEVSVALPAAPPRLPRMPAARSTARSWRLGAWIYPHGPEGPAL